MRGAAFSPWRVGTLPQPAIGRGVGTEGLWRRRPLSDLAHAPTFWGTGGLAVPPAGAVPPAPAGGRVVFVVACALLQRKGLAWRAPLSHRPTLQRFWKQGDAIPPATARRRLLLCGDTPTPPAWGTKVASLHPPMRRLRTALANPPLGTGAGTEQPPARLAWGMDGGREFVTWRVETLPSLPPSTKEGGEAGPVVGGRGGSFPWGRGLV